MRYTVTVYFERLNSAKKKETSSRFFRPNAENKEAAKKEGLKLFKKAEPNRRKISKVTVELEKD